MSQRTAVVALVATFLLACSGAVEAPVASPAPEPPAEPADDGLTRTGEPTEIGRGVPLRVKLFDANATHAAIQVIHDPWLVDDPENFPPPISCGYAGMKEWPEAGVTLAVVELASGKAQVFEVYEVATKQAACTPDVTSSARRAEAEAAMKAVGLDPAKRLEPVATRAPDGFTIAGRPVEVRARREMVDDWGEAEGQLVADGRALFTSRQGYNPSMASWREIDFSEAYAVDDGYVFVEKMHDFSGRGGDSWVFSVTPVVRIR